MENCKDFFINPLCSSVTLHYSALESKRLSGYVGNWGRRVFLLIYVLIWLGMGRKKRCFPCSSPSQTLPRTTDAQRSLFSTISQYFGSIRQIRRINFGVFMAELSAPFLALWVPCPWFPSVNIHKWCPVFLALLDLPFLPRIVQFLPSNVRFLGSFWNQTSFMGVPSFSCFFPQIILLFRPNPSLFQMWYWPKRIWEIAIMGP